MRYLGRKCCLVLSVYTDNALVSLLGMDLLRTQWDYSYGISVLSHFGIHWICECESLAWVVQCESLTFGSTAMFGRTTFWFWVISAVTFYGATWENYFTNSLILPTINGPTEEISTCRAVLFLMTAFGVIPTASSNMSNVYRVVKARKGSMLLTVAMLFPFFILLGGVLAWDYLSINNLIESYPQLVVTGTGLAFGFLVGRMILAHLCDEPKGLNTNTSMIGQRSDVFPSCRDFLIRIGITNQHVRA
ncbi:hypothetical protein SAY86_002694 [Trapa natans]|uniref:Uncharacterized protein n=1 Tax=Trapa natans TaxID=22666 RepID=A0AAN7R2Q1_TRANT|nr:hypothetical protein SAY86_002694 [Trapa natans]